MSDIDFNEEHEYPEEGQWADTPAPEGEESQEERRQDDEVDNTVYAIEQKEVNFKIDRKISSEAIEDVEAAISFVAENPKTVEVVLERYDNVLKKLSEDEQSLPEGDKSWLKSLIVGLSGIVMSDAPIGATERKGSIWRQGVSSVDEDYMMRPGVPSFRMDKSKKYTKEEMSVYLSGRSGFGVPYDTFLPDSGIWLRLRTPTLSEIIAMQTDLQKERIRLGMETKGLAYSNSSSVLLNIVTTMALNCVIRANCKYMSPADLEEQLTVYDEALLHHALASTMFPNGYNYQEPCVADPSSCASVITMKLNVSSIVWFDELSFTSEQRKFISGRLTKVRTDEELKTYRDGFLDSSERVYWIGDIGLKLNIPTIAKRKNTADEWRGSLIEMSKGVFNEPPHGNNRSAFIDNLAQAQTALQYAHFVTAIYEKDDEATNLEDMFLTDDEDVITDYIQDVLSSPELSEDYFDTIEKFINDSVKGIVAIPSHDCKECKSPQGLEHSKRFPHLVPLDTLQKFFTLAGQKAAQ